jgi:hypothetical protein
MCGVSAGATKASLTAHFALDSNMADVQAKEGSQETAVTLLGLLAGGAFAHWCNNNSTTIWVAFGLLVRPTACALTAGPPPLTSTTAPHPCCPRKAPHVALTACTRPPRTPRAPRTPRTPTKIACVSH